MKHLPLLIFLSACSAPTVVVDSSSPTVELQGPSQLQTGEANVFIVTGSAEGDRSISRLELQVRSADNDARSSGGIAGQSEARFCVRLDPTVDCAGYDATLDLPASFGRDDLRVMIEGRAHDDGPAHRLGTSTTHEAAVVDTSPPIVELLQPEHIDPDQTIGLRVRIFDRHSGAAALNYRVRLLSSACMARVIEGTLTSFVPAGDHEIGLITLAVPPGLRSGVVRIEQLEVSDLAATPNKTAVEARDVCIGSCADSMPPNTQITRVRWLVNGQTAVALNDGDGVHPGANLEITVSAADQHSNVRQIWAQVDGENPTPPVDNETCTGLSNTGEETFQVQAPEGVDGDTFVLRAGAFDDVGAGGDHNLGLAPEFNLELSDDIQPDITAITLLDVTGNPATPEVGGQLRVAVSATDTYGRIARLQLRVDDQTGTVATEGEVEILDPPSASLTDYASPVVLQLPTPNDRRATENWTLRVTIWDDASPPNPRSSTLTFLPSDGQNPVLSQTNGGGDLNLSNGRSASVQISGSDAARYVARVQLTDLVVGQSGVSNRTRQTTLPPEQASASQVQVTIPVPTNAKEGTISALPRIIDDSGNASTGNRVNFNLVDNVQPVVSAVFNPNILVPGGPVRLEVNATDVNSDGIALIRVGNVDHITWSNQSIANRGTVVFTGTVTENPGAIDDGLPVQASVTVTDRANAGNQRAVVASATIRDEAGPIITIVEVSEGLTGGTATLRIQARDLSGVVASTSYAATINRFASNTPFQRNQTINYGVGQRVSDQAQTFSVAIPSNAAEGQYSILFSATDGEGNTSQFTATGNRRLRVVDRTAPTALTLVSAPAVLTTGASSTIRVQASDVSSGIATLRLEASGAGVNTTLNENCNNTSPCLGTFELPIPSNAGHGQTVTLAITAIDGSDAGNSVSINPSPTRAIDDAEAPTLSEFTNPLPVQVTTGGTLQLTMRGQDVSSGLASAAVTVPCGSVTPVTIQGAPTIVTTFFATWNIPADCDAVGQQSVAMTLTDVAGNAAAETTLSLTVIDNQSPTVSFRSPPSVISNTDTPAIDVRIVDPGSGAASISLSSSCGTVSNNGTITIAGGPATSNKSFTLTDLANCAPGSLTLTLSGTDVAGNSSGDVVHQPTLRDAIAPSANLAVSSSTVDVSTSITLTATIHDPSSGLASLAFTVPCGTVSGDNPTAFNGETTQQVVQRTWSVPATCRTLGTQSVSIAVADQSAHSSDGQASQQVTLRDLTVPTIAWNAPPATISLANGATLTADAQDPSSGIARVSFSLANQAQGAFDPTQRNIGGAPVSTSANSLLTPVSTLLHGAVIAVSAIARDVAGNDSAAASTNLTLSDDVPPVSITAAPQLATNRIVGTNRFAVAAGETVTIDLAASDINSGIATLNMNVTVGGNTTTQGNAAGNGIVNFATSLNYDVPGGASDGDEITITPRADDTSDANGFEAGTAIVLVVDTTPPTTNPTLATPTTASTFGVARSFRCLGQGNTGLGGAAGSNDTVSVNVTITPTPAGFPDGGQDITVSNAAWALLPAGFTWANQTEYAVTIKGRDAVGNLQVTGATFTLRGDTTAGTWIATPSFATSTANSTSGQADYQPVMTGSRSVTTGGSMLVVGQFDCGTQSDQADATPGTGTYTINEPGAALSLGQSNSLDCSWRLTESYCNLERLNTGNTNFSKPNLAPTAATAQQINGSNTPVNITDYWPTFSGTHNDPINTNTNQITQSRSVEMTVYNQAGGTIWSSGLTAASLADGGSTSADFPRWRPPGSSVLTGEGTAKRRNNTVYWFGRGSSPDVHLLDLSKNSWRSTSEQRAMGQGPTAWGSNDAILALPDGTWLRVTPNGTHLSGSDTDGTITWNLLGAVTGNTAFPSCSSVRLTTMDTGSGSVLMWCRSADGLSLHRLLSFILTAPIAPATQWTFEALAMTTVPTVASDFEVTRLSTSHDYRVLPGSGNGLDILGARLDTTGFTPSWTTSPTGTGQSLNLTAGCSIASTSATSYLVLAGNSSAWSVAANATPSADTFSAVSLPDAQTINAAGLHLSDGDETHDAVALLWHTTHALRPVVWVAADTAFATPPDPAGNEEALIDGATYSWDLRFTDEGGLAGTYLGPGVRQDFNISIP